MRTGDRDAADLIGAAGAAILTAASRGLTAIVPAPTLISHNVFAFTTLGPAAILSRSAFVLATVFAHRPQTYTHR